jgi:hypothetical protein
LVVAASAFGAVVLYRYVDVGRLGPLPNMYEPTWAPPGKAASAWAEGAGIILAAAGRLGQPPRLPHRPVVVRERAALLDGPREQEFLHWARDGLELHGCFPASSRTVALAGRTWANRWRGRSDARHVPVGDGDPPSPARIDASAPTA